MADKDLGDGDGPSLEMPSLGSLFRRKKSKQGPDQDDSLTPAADEPDEAASAAQAPAPEAPAEPGTEDTQVVPVVEEPAQEPTVALQRPVAAEEHTGLPEGQPEPDVAPATHTTPVADEEPEDETDETDDEDGETAPARRRERRQFALPAVPGRVAAIITGLIIGALAVGLTWLAVQGCEAVKGTSTCGTPGFFLLIAIMILLVVLGSALLGAWKVADPGSTSFLAVGLLAVIALLFLIRVIFSPWMIVVIPLVAVATYLVSHWLTSLFVEESESV